MGGVYNETKPKLKEIVFQDPVDGEEEELAVDEPYQDQVGAMGWGDA